MKHSKAIEVLGATEEGAPFGSDDVAAALVELRAGVDGDGLQLKYFVLKPGGTGAHARASRSALVAYANTLLANDVQGQLPERLQCWAKRDSVSTADLQRLLDEQT